jgi:anti-anti-sigma regulatory factor
MLRIVRVANEETVFRLIGRMDAENVAELQQLFKAEAENQQIVLDLKDLTLVDRDAVSFLERCEALGIKLTNCPAYIREWVDQERSAN